MVKYIIIQ
ncbi:UNVERIFIED_CONTAM: hypothetical protein GTU68_063247 [Idotea baltica]|nr:hypothetical protein [Idotea baltica]